MEHIDNLKLTTSKNLKDFIEHTGRSHQWIITKSGIPKSTYYKMLNGEGDLDKHIVKIIDLFGIDNPYYFHSVNFKIEARQESDITKHIAANYVQVEGEKEAFIETLTMMNDFVNMIDILKRNNSTNNNKYMHLFE